MRPGTWGVEAIVQQTAAYDTLVVETCDGFEICDITVAGKTQFLVDVPLPASVFAPGGVGGIQLLLGQPGQPPQRMPAGTRVGLKVRNTTEEPRSFKAKLIVAPDSP
jgi:hypothetical protein